MIEIETKIVDFDEMKTRASLDRMCAGHKPKTLLRRWVFDLEKEPGEDRFIRVRTDGAKSTITYKLRKGSGLSNTEEIEVSASDFDAAAEIFGKMLTGNRYYQENYVETWVYDGVEVTLHNWPMIPSVIEVEGRSENDVRSTIKELGISGKELGNISWVKVYDMHGIDLHAYPVLKFEGK